MNQKKKRNTMILITIGVFIAALYLFRKQIFGFIILGIAALMYS